MNNENTKAPSGKGKDQSNVIRFPGTEARNPEEQEHRDLSLEEQSGKASLSAEPETISPEGQALPVIKKVKPEALLALALEQAKLFHTADRSVFADVIQGGIRKTLMLRTKDTTHWLNELSYRGFGMTPVRQTLNTVINVLEAKALFEGPERIVHLRYGSHGGCVYIDLGNDKWEQVEISNRGWRILASHESSVRFRREQGMAAMCYPASNGSFEPLRQILNLDSEVDFILMVSWLIGAMNPKGPFPIMVLVGEQGSSKSTTAKMLKGLTDPATIGLVALPKCEQDLAIAAQRTWTLPYDNLSKITDGMSDAFCRLATGGGFRTRTLYTNEDEMMFSSVRPLIMNGISDFVTRQDLADRSILIHLPSIPEQRRLPEKVLYERWREARPLIFGAICDALSTSLRNLPHVELPTYPRMADFAQLIVAAEPVLPWKSGAFLQAYFENREKMIDVALEADEVATTVIALVEKTAEKKWVGTATELKDALDAVVDERTRRLRSWPKKSNMLSNRVRRCATFLRSKGIHYERGKSGNRYIVLRKIEDATAQTVSTVRPEPPPAVAAKSYTFDSNGPGNDDGNVDIEEGEI
jgi:energy-coupling factor transporter ATP-binding protein EcfA2